MTFATPNYDNFTYEQNEGKVQHVWRKACEDKCAADFELTPLYPGDE